MLLFRLTTKTYLSPQLLVYMPIDVPFMTLPVDFILSFRLTVKIYPSTFLHVHRCACSSVYLFSLFLLFGITCTMTFQLVYWGTYTQIHPKINLPVYPHASLSSNHKGLPVSTTTWVKCCLMSSDVSWHIRDKLWPMPKHGSIILYVHGNQKAR